MMNFLRRSLSLEIEDFVIHIKTSIGKHRFANFTKSAFVQCRKKIKPEVFKHLSSKLIQEFYTNNDMSIQLWNGFRLLSVDGSYLVLPNTKELESTYGKAINQTRAVVAQARISVLYDVLNRFVIDGTVSPLINGEKALSIGHLEYAKKGDLIIYDRGYPSFNLVYEHYEKGIDFLMRTKINYNLKTRTFYESGAHSQIVKINPGKGTKISNKPYKKDTYRKVRLVRVDLHNGATEILMTSLQNEIEYPNAIFKVLYSQRWGVETFYDELKNKLKVEYFSGYSQQSILQDFYAALFVFNVQSLIVGEINKKIAPKSNTKYQYKVNNNLSYGFLKNRIVTLSFSDSDISIVISELQKLFQKHLVPIRPNRKINRNMIKFSRRTKPKVLKNMKNAI